MKETETEVHDYKHNIFNTYTNHHISLHMAHIWETKISITPNCGIIIICNDRLVKNTTDENIFPVMWGFECVGSNDKSALLCLLCTH